MEAKNDEKEKNHFKQKEQMQKAHGKKKNEPDRVEISKKEGKGVKVIRDLQAKGCLDLLYVTATYMLSDLG